MSREGKKGRWEGEKGSRKGKGGERERKQSTRSGKNLEREKTFTSGKVELDSAVKDVKY